MNISGLLGIKLEQSQAFTPEGKRIPVTILRVGPCSVVQIKTLEHDGYSAVQLGIGVRKAKNISKAVRGHNKKAGIGEENLPRFLQEIRTTSTQFPDAVGLGTTLHASDIFKVGDRVRVTGISKGKGFAGVVKRHHFRGGPRTHGQSDRERAPGSIGQTTTPGRVYKGKRMAGHLGQEKVTLKNLSVVTIDSDNDVITIKGVIPGPKGNLVQIIKE